MKVSLINVSQDSRTEVELMAKTKANDAGGWLFKEEPSCFSYADLEQAGSTVWAGVKNALARQHLRNLQIGDRVLYYHTGKERAIVGEMRVVGAPSVDPDSDDPKSVVVKVEPIRRWEPAVTLEQIKNDPVFADWELIRISRLSVMPVSGQIWRRLEAIRDG
jgi:predicted RNA-binding protein with PUA-like domain